MVHSRETNQASVQTTSTASEGLGKRMEMYWPVHDMFRMRIPLQGPQTGTVAVVELG